MWTQPDVQVRCHEEREMHSDESGASPTQRRCRPDILEEKANEPARRVARRTRDPAMIQLSSAGKRFGSKVLFEGFDWLLTPGDRIGLVGGNGAGWI